MLHAAFIALSSLLLFLVQPLIARLILPWFGGGAAVWTTCMLFFQTLLLAGYAVGDSITAGSHDNIPSDDTSLDLRNTGGGFEPILSNLLTAANGYPHTVVNEGISGDTSEEGVVLISTPGPNNPLTKNPSANHVLVMYGTNDANIGNGPVTKATYKANMQAIITAIINAGKKPYVAKVPYVDSTNPMFPAGESFSNVAIQQYNQAIDELVADPLNGIGRSP